MWKRKKMKETQRNRKLRLRSKRNSTFSSSSSSSKNAVQFQSNDDDKNYNSVEDNNHSSVCKGDEHDHDHAAEMVEESDSSEDEVAPRNTIGNVSLAWYKDEEHIGYDVSGKKINKKRKRSRIDSFLEGADDLKSWRKIVDEYNDEEVKLNKEEINVIRRMMKRKAPHADFDPHPSYVDWFDWDGAKHPLSNAPEPKRRFVGSKWEAEKILKYVRAIRKGLIDDKPEEKPKIYALWDDEADSVNNRRGLAHIPAPKAKLPGHEESYNPSLEYIPMQEELDSYQHMFEEDRPKFIPKQFTSIRSIPAYEKAVKDNLERCFDLYLCPRAPKKRINIDPELLRPKLPSFADLKPYPTKCYLEYKGHKGPVVSISADSTGQWIASGSKDGTVRVWEVETGRCLRVWNIGEPVCDVSWNPMPELPILAVAAGRDVLVLNTGCGSDEHQRNIEDLLRVEPQTGADDSGINASIVNWVQDDTHEGIRLKHFKSVSKVEWHRRGDYLLSLMPAGDSRSVLIHKLSRRHSQRIPFKMKGIPVATAFHPARSRIFVATKKCVRVYDLLMEKLIKKLEPGVREISSLSIHPSGDHAIVGSKDGRLCWFDMDLSPKQPLKVFRYQNDITGVAYHRSYPLFASSTDDCTTYVYHGMVYSDLNQDPLIVPVEILREHDHTLKGRDVTFHPKQPWLFSAGADSTIKLFCDYLPCSY